MNLRSLRLNEEVTTNEVRIKETKLLNKMKKDGYDYGSYYEFLKDTYGIEKDKDYKVDNSGLILTFNLDQIKDNKKISNLKKDLCESVDNKIESYWKGKINESEDDSNYAPKAPTNYPISSEIAKNLKGEWDAIQGYDILLELFKSVNDSEAIDSVNEIIADEKNHAEKLANLLLAYDGVIEPNKD